MVRVRVVHPSQRRRATGKTQLKAYMCWGFDERSLEDLVALAHARWVIEQSFEHMKDELGLDHFEGRSWPGWHHHVTMVMVAYCYTRLAPPLYLSPEQVLGEGPTKASDMYAAAAAIAYELLTGHHYLETRGKSDLDLRQAIARGSFRAPAALPQSLATWLERGLAKNPEERWIRIAAMVSALPASEAKSVPERRR